MVRSRPFATDPAVFEAAERVWWRLTPADWRDAFAQHPRIGKRGGGAWSEQEQAGTASASDGVRRALAEGNRQYEDRFGHVFLICATGLSADYILGELTRRLTNDPAREVQVAAAEQAKITRLRLEKLTSQ
jgi:2-oxo-4-hydroxy-4-carboxy-5-ureidoimidazoline decarboxylase